MENKIYKDRADAGRVLAREIKKKEITDGVVIAIPRGGVVTAAQAAEVLELPIDIIIPRKIGAPFNPEVAIGAVTQDGSVILTDNKHLVQFISKDEIKEIAQKEINEIKRRMVKYRGDANYPNYIGKTVIIIDDGIATGFTTRAAIMSIKKILNPKKTILAVPVAPVEVIQTLSADVDEIICPLVPETFYAVGQFYENFDQVSDEEVINLLHKSRKK
ncbi:Predicted phosphoribosyltransferase [Desulfotomaculum arcticum]|uniref:Predicted phosphoribosyltransferase n=1 Tax=Desulfotruncus arcticus DSM 17038 TaxID=1121424 RepID=A0A1I2VMD5_9FIRM|nr:phosphoribosyltransferase family protein [Desulfotruncus arcticus]SFG90290.1 Predicted phosphoribosyltransferase [Desulfotomaculum arcticum] [Desulfotruncus arcticus DSM 17038]